MSHDQPFSAGENTISGVKSVDYQGHTYLMWKSTNIVQITLL